MEENEFIKIVTECKSMLSASKQVGMSFSSFKRKAIKLGCYNPNQSGKGTTKENSKISLDEILDGLHPNYQTYKLKIRLLKEGYFQDECCKCGWKEKPKGSEFTPCELDHINGDPTDHRLENLRLICPNCHSLTETYRFRRGKTNGIEHQDEKSLE